ncbi:MAG: orotidine-5'-phosphate decarboxylase [Candidatus Woesearchaeota archaeon]
MDSNNFLDAKNHLCLPLDVATGAEALTIVDELKDYIGVFKIGLQLYTAEGPAIIKEIRKRGCKIFLDLKFHDIPNTVAQAVKEVAKLDVSYLTIHLSGGSEMVKAAVNALSDIPEQSRLMLLGVTVLTSISSEQLHNELHVTQEMSAQVRSFIELGVKNGIRGIVCSPQELSHLKKDFPQIHFVTPGIRPVWSEKNDQQRIATPTVAIRDGASLLVIGRPILNAPNRVDAAKKILEEIFEGIMHA